MSIEQEVEIFRGITEKMNKIFECKRHDYGQTTTETFERFGPVSMLTRMYDKIGRLENLIVRGDTNYVVDEKVEDTLLDLANYAIITILEMQKQKQTICKVEVNDGKKDIYRS